MPRFYSLALVVTAALIAGVLAGCDDSPTHVEDIEIQPQINVSSSNLTFFSGTTPPSFQISYQGLNSVPELQVGGDFTLERLEETGSPTDGGSQTWAVDFLGDVPLGEAVEDSITVRAMAGGQEITHTVDVRVNSPVSATQDFTSQFAVIADYEEEQREISTDGGTTIETVSGADVVAEGSNGLSALQVDASGSGSVTFDRRTNAPGAGFFTFLIRSDADTEFTLTLTFADEADGATQTYDLEVPVDASDAWRKYTIATDQIFDDFNPVAQRAGGDGPLLSVSMSASADVSYMLDELAFGTESAPTIEINDFERTSLAYGGGCPPMVQDADVVADESDGFTSRRVVGAGCFGYNYQTASAGPALFLDASSESTFSFRAQASEGDSLFVFLETAGGSYGYGTGTTVALPVDEWGTVSIPVSELGGPASALRDPGITNVGFEAAGEEPNFHIDDIKLRAPN